MKLYEWFEKTLYMDDTVVEVYDSTIHKTIDVTTIEKWLCNPNWTRYLYHPNRLFLGEVPKEDKIVVFCQYVER